MPRSSEESEFIARYAARNAAPPPPPELTEEQRQFWVRICTDLPANHVRSDCTPVLAELCRHLSYAAQIAEALDSMRTVPLADTGRTKNIQRTVFFQLLKHAREQSKLIADLSIKLRLLPQVTTRARDAARERARTPVGRRPWEWEPAVVRNASDDDDSGSGSASS